MKKATKFDDQESLKLPGNQVLAILMDSDEAGRVIATLSRDGFSSNEIGALSGIEDAEKLDAASGNEGFFAKLVTSGIDMGDRDIDYLKLYRRALLNGRTVVGVAAKDDETRNKARKILKEGGARFITFFGQFVTEVLEG